MKVVDYVLVDQVSGEIQVSGRCQDADLDAQPEAGHQVKVVGYGTRATHYYTPMGLCEYTLEQRAAKSQEQPHSRWDNGLMKWIDVRPLTELRAERWAQVKAARVAAVDAPIETPWGLFDADAPSRAAIAQALALDDPTGTITWTRADNTDCLLFRSTLAEVLRLIDERTQDARRVARTLRSRIDAAASIDDLEAITWPQAP